MIISTAQKEFLENTMNSHGRQNNRKLMPLGGRKITHYASNYTVIASDKVWTLSLFLIVVTIVV